MGSVVRRLAITVAVVAAYLAVGELAPIPDVNPAAMGWSIGHRYLVGVFALGLTPVLTAYMTVEVVAFLVPRLSRLRHENPAGRAKLDRAVMVVAMLLAAIQGFAMALTLDDAPHSISEGVTSSGWTFRLITTATVVAGVAVSITLARVITARGIANGYVVLFAAIGLRTFVEDIARATHWLPPAVVYINTHLPSDHPDLRAWGVASAAFALVVYATLRCIHAARAPSVSLKGHTNPYRAAQMLLMHPVVPVPTGSLQSYAAALWLMTVPTLLHTFGIAAAPAIPDNVGVQVALTLAMASGLNVILGRAMHRPAELNALARKVGAEVGGEARAAIRQTYLPSILFFAVLTFANRAFFVAIGVGLSLAPFLVAALVDVVRAVRESDDRTWVVVWEDRRITAVHAIRAVLDSHGIEARIDGLAVLWLLQAFAPFAPAHILVPDSEREKAATVLDRLLPGGDPIAMEPSPLLREPRRSEARALGLPLALCAFAAVVAMALSRSPDDEAVTRHAMFEIVRVDDTFDAFQGVQPTTAKIALRTEEMPTGLNRTSDSHYAEIGVGGGESESAAKRQLAAWLATLRVPAGVRLAIRRDVDEEDHLVRFKSYVLRGEPIAVAADVTSAEASIGDNDEVKVNVVLTPDAARRLEAFTGEWVERRIAIVVDGDVLIAPVVRSRIPGGRVSITLGHGDDAALQRRARELAAALRP